MQSQSLKLDLHLGDHALEGSTLTCWKQFGGKETWSLDLPTVLWILERVAAGEGDAREIRAYLLHATKWDSACCSSCDLAMSHFSEARRRHEQTVRRWRDEQQQLNPDSYPYLLNKGKIHRPSCRRPPRPAPPQFPEDLHTFGVLFGGNGGDLDQVLDFLAGQASGGACQVGPSEVVAMMARDGVAAVKSRLCGACEPRLPDLDPATPEGRPACWAWVMPSDVAVVTAGVTPVIDANVLPHQRAAYAELEHWHEGRCAVCGQGRTVGRLVRDHDHASGLIRGLLCSSCNTAEGRTDSLLFNNYRRRPPSVILGIEVLYLPAGFKPGTHHLGLPVR